MRKKKSKAGRPSNPNRLVTVSGDISQSEKAGLAKVGKLTRAKSRSEVIRQSIVEHLLKFGVIYNDKEG